MDANNVRTCPSCGTYVEPDHFFCKSCGTKVEIEVVESTTPVEQTKPTTTVTEPIETKTPTQPARKYVEPSNVFADGLPDWSIEPPLVVVRRKSGK